MKEQELEVKFYLDDLPAFEKRLQALGAELIHPRVHEINLRFDTPDGALTQARRVLRLRRDDRTRLTYKGPAHIGEEVSIRQEIEFEISDFEAARKFLMALGYQVSIMYEKKRTTYLLNNTEVVLDEMPFGDFTEIEGSDVTSIRKLALALHLNWDARCVESYLRLFDLLRQRRGLEIQNLRFVDFQEMSFTAADFGLKPADIS